MRRQAIWLLLTGCISMNAPIPMASLKDARNSGHAKCLLVMLPGAGDRPDRFAQEGLIEQLRSRALSVDVISADATLGYYTRNIVIERLEQDVFAAATGYEETWLVGTSLGGLGSLSYARQHATLIHGVLALSPWLGSSSITKEIRDAGGLAHWQAPAEPDGPERQLWKWLQAVAVKGEPGPELFLGWGDADRLAPDDALLGAALPPERVFHSAGGHGWKTWRELFARFLDESSFAGRCAR
jgi:pimeloyl-ACP methyl ester carboxylesterase